MRAFEGKVAVVTGGTRGLGRTITEKFLENRAKVAICYRTNDKAANQFLKDIKPKNYKLILMKTDVSDPKAVDIFKHEVLTKFGTVDILINNAGFPGKVAKIDGLEADDFLGPFKTNILGTFNVTKAFIATMIEKHYGRIVNLSSVAAKGDQGMGAYASSKAGVEALTKCHAIEFGRYGITVNVIRPAYINAGLALERLNEEQKEKFAKKTCVKRLGLATEVASEVLYLSSENASYINGQVRDIDGGLF